MPNPQDTQALHQEVAHCLALAESYFERRFPSPEIRWNNRRSKVAGSANLSDWRLSFNSHFYQQDPQAFLEQTVAHEVAHLIAHAVYGRVRAHGPEWQHMMEKVMGKPATRTHGFSLGHLNQQSFPYHCSCREHQLTLRRHNKVKRGQCSYQCRHCGELLCFTAPNQDHA